MSCCVVIEWLEWHEADHLNLNIILQVLMIEQMVRRKPKKTWGILERVS